VTAERTQDQCHDASDRQEPHLGAVQTVVWPCAGPLVDPFDSVAGGVG
jgi:hypothetical protein